MSPTDNLSRYAAFTCAVCIASAHRADMRFLGSFPLADQNDAERLGRKWERDALAALLGAQPQSRKHYRGHSK